MQMQGLEAVRSHFTSDEIHAEADSRETSFEIMRVIMELTATDEEMQRVWANPTQMERYVIIELAWGYADSADDDDTLEWGGTITR